MNRFVAGALVAAGMLGFSQDDSASPAGRSVVRAELCPSALVPGGMVAVSPAGCEVYFVNDRVRAVRLVPVCWTARMGLYRVPLEALAGTGFVVLQYGLQEIARIPCTVYHGSVDAATAEATLHWLEDFALDGRSVGAPSRFLDCYKALLTGVDEPFMDIAMMPGRAFAWAVAGSYRGATQATLTVKLGDSVIGQVTRSARLGPVLMSWSVPKRDDRTVTIECLAITEP